MTSEFVSCPSSCNHVFIRFLRFKSLQCSSLANNHSINFVEPFHDRKKLPKSMPMRSFYNFLSLIIDLSSCLSCLSTLEYTDSDNLIRNLPDIRSIIWIIILNRKLQQILYIGKHFIPFSHAALKQIDDFYDKNFLIA
jgi:hypothetical protein